MYNLVIFNHRRCGPICKGEFVMLFAPKEKGQGLVEYALIIVLIAIVVIVAMNFLGPTIGNVFNDIGGTLQSP